MKSINIHFYTHFLSLIILIIIPRKGNYSSEAALFSFNQTKKFKQVKKQQIRITEWDSILPPQIENEKTIIWPNFLLFNPLILISNSKYKHFLAKNEKNYFR